MRSKARESVFMYIFSRLFNPSDEGLFDVLIKDLSNDDKKFAQELLGIIDNDQEKYLKIIEQLSFSYKLNRIHAADKCALLLGIAEMDKYKSTPKAVVIDEAVNLVAKYSTENSTDFVNGVLAKYAKENSCGENN